jgi:hypothetical protein
MKEYDEYELKILLEYNAKEAEELKNYIRSIDKNLFNKQFIMDWQDRLNAVSITDKEDLVDNN